VNVETQTVVLAVLVAVVGMPHGGLDHRFGRALLRPALGGRWMIVFGAGYLAVMALVLAGWLLAPLLALAGFVLLSAVHFGLADDDLGLPGGLAPTALQGGMVVWVPALFQPAEFTRLLTWVVPGDRWPENILFDSEVRFGLWAALAVIVVRAAVSPKWSAARTLGFLVVFAVAPPLVGFVVYFCFWHSVIELVRLGRWADMSGVAVGVRRVIVTAAPLSALAVLLGVFGFALVAADRPLTPGLVQTVFVGLSVVAVPHMLLNLVAARRNVNPFASEVSR